MPLQFNVALSDVRIVHLGSGLGFAYLLPDGTQLGVSQSACWCNACGAFALVEQMESLAQYDAWIAEAEPFLMYPGRLAHRYEDPMAQSRLELHVKYLPELRRRREWRATRRSPPRCLECGSTRTIQLLDGRETDVPGVGRATLRVRALTGDFWAPPRLYTPEGERIGPAREVCSPRETHR